MLERLFYMALGIGALLVWTVGAVIEAIKDRLDKTPSVW